jgi:hypothetical protein
MLEGTPERTFRGMPGKMVEAKKETIDIIVPFQLKAPTSLAKACRLGNRPKQFFGLPFDASTGYFTSLTFSLDIALPLISAALRF